MVTYDSVQYNEEEEEYPINNHAELVFFACRTSCNNIYTSTANRLVLITFADPHIAR